MVDKIVEGRMNKFYEEVCLYEQPFIRENATTRGRPDQGDDRQSSAKTFPSRVSCASRSARRR